MTGVAGVLLSALLLQPMLAEPGDLRVVSVGADAEWRLDGEPVAATADGEAATIAVPAGRHQLLAVTVEEGRWRALARLEPEAPDGAAFVPAWTAEHRPRPPGLPGWAGPAVLVLAALAAALPQAKGADSASSGGNRGNLTSGGFPSADNG